MTGQEFGVRYRRANGSEYVRFSDDFTERGARQMVAASLLLRHHRDDTGASARRAPLRLFPH